MRCGRRHDRERARGLIYRERDGADPIICEAAGGRRCRARACVRVSGRVRERGNKVTHLRRRRSRRRRSTTKPGQRRLYRRRRFFLLLQHFFVFSSD